MLKKLISGVMSVIIALSMLAGISVNAASPIVYDGTVVNVFDQSFENLSGASEVSDFSLGGSWKFTEYFMIGGQTASKTVDMSGADGYEFSADVIASHNGFTMELGWDSAKSTGYQIYFTSTTAYLYKNQDFNDDLNSPKQYTVAGDSVSSRYKVPTTYKVKVSGNTVTVTTKTIVSGTEKTVLTYTDEDAPSMSGVFGVRNQSTGDFTVFNMKLDKINENTVVNNWRYEKVFSSEDTREQLKKDGVTLSKAPFSFNDSGIYTQPNNITTFSPNGGALVGNYTFETAFTMQMNSYQVEFNYIDDNNYYSIFFDRKNVTLRKTTNASGTTTTTDLDTEACTSSGLNSWRVKAKYKISVTENADGSLGIYATVSGGNQTAELTYTDTEPFTTRGTARLNQKGYTGSAGDAGHSVLYYVKAYATPTNAVTGTRDVTVVDRVFKTGDTVEGLTNEGFVFVTTPLSITTPTDYTKSGVTYPYGDKWNYSSATYSPWGISWNNASDKGNNGTVYYNKTLSGDYTATASTRVSYNATTFYINRKDSNNYYKLVINGNGKTVTLAKKVGGTSYAASNFTVNGTFGFYNYNGCGLETTIDVKHNDKGGIDFTITCQEAPWKYQPAVLTVTDDGVTNGPIVPEGKFRVEVGNTARSALCDMKIVEHQKIVDDGEFKGEFYNGDNFISKYEKGNIYFDFPTSAIGSYTVVAALYEDNMMTGLKTFEPIDLYADRVSLFNTTNSTAENASIKVYLLDTSSTLNQVTQVWELK